MTTLREAATQALEALQNCANGEDDVLLTRDALAALRAALAEPTVPSDCTEDSHQRKPLTKVDLRALYDRHAAYQEEGPEASGWWDFARAIERAHGIGGEA